MEQKIVDTLETMLAHKIAPRRLYMHPDDWRSMTDDPVLQAKCHYPTEYEMPPGAVCVFLGVPVMLDAKCPRLPATRHMYVMPPWVDDIWELSLDDEVN